MVIGHALTMVIGCALTMVIAGMHEKSQTKHIGQVCLDSLGML